MNGGKFRIGERDPGLLKAQLEAEKGRKKRREDLAVKMDVSANKFATREAMVEFAGRDYDDSNAIDSTMFILEVEAKLKVMAADALIAELEK